MGRAIMLPAIVGWIADLTVSDQWQRLPKGTPSAELSLRNDMITVKQLHNNRGFTILESMIASVVLILAVVSVLAVSAQSFRYLTGIRRTARSSQVLQQKLEDLRLYNWTQMQSLPGTFSDPNDTSNIYKGTIATSAFDTYNGTTTVMRVTLTVTYTNQTHSVVSNSLTTLIGNGGLNKYIF